MSVIFLFAGKQMSYVPGKSESFRVDYQKEKKPGDIFFIERVLSDGDQFGKPYLDFKLEAEVVKHGKKKKIRILTYKAKKREKKVKGHRTRYSEIKIIKILK